MAIYEVFVLAYCGKRDEAEADTKRCIREVGGEITEERDDGEKTLAYSIHGETRARYLSYVIKAANPKNTTMARRLDKKLRAEPSVLRYLVVKAKEK